ncbi:MAG: hypothetical protein QGG40_14315 [Myxococcota bacterium]|jgi:hypothetical protein|nr:hypothetical protein [Myxococcota bacterium]
MSRALLVLQRIREQKKRGARLSHASAVRKQEERREAIEELNSSIAATYEAEPEMASDLAYASVYRARMRLRASREERHLRKHTQNVDAARTRLMKATIEAEVIGRVIESERTLVEKRRKRIEERSADGLSTARWAGYSA